MPTRAARFTTPVIASSHLRTRAALLFYSLLSMFLLPLSLRGAAAQDSDLYQAALQAFHQQNFSSAAALFQQVETANKGATDALLYLAKCQINLQRFGSADTSLTSYVAAHPSNADAAFLLGYVLFRQNKASDSLAAYTHAATLMKPKAGDLKIVALDYVLLEDNVSAVHWLRRSTELDPSDSEAWYFLGRSLFHQSLFPNARQAFEQSLHLMPHSVRARNNLGLTFEAEDRLSDASREYQQAIAEDRLQHRRRDGSAAGDTSGLTYPLPRPHAEDSRTAPQDLALNDTAIAAIPKQPENAGETRAQPYLNYGSLLIRENRASEAREALRESTEIAPDCVVCHQQLGRALAHLQKIRDARAQLEIAVKLRPEDAALHYELGLLCQKDGDTGAAKAELMRSKELYGTRASDPTSR